MTTKEITQDLVGKRVNGIFTGLAVTGTITGIYEDQHSKGVEIELDKPIMWGAYTYERYTSTARKHDDWGNLELTQLIEGQTGAENPINVERAKRTKKRANEILRQIAIEERKMFRYEEAWNPRAVEECGIIIRSLYRELKKVNNNIESE